MIQRSLAAHPMTAEAVESFNRLLALYATRHSELAEAWASAERIMRALVSRVEYLERENETLRQPMPPPAMMT